MLKISHLIKHDVYLEELCMRIESDYDYLLKNVPLYSPRKRKVAEVDILAVKEGVIDVYEVKCSFRLTKAKKQLKRIRRVLSTKIRKTFFFCGESQTLLVL